jgi:hypothetical protein
VFCERCGRNLSSVERLPTAGERETLSLQAFLEQMRAAGNPGTGEFECGKPRAFRRTPKLTGWIVVPVDREDFDGPKRYEPGVLLSVDGTFHRLDNELRGWGQRDFPRYEHTASPEPVDEPPSARLLDELEALRASL